MVTVIIIHVEVELLIHILAPLLMGLVMSRLTWKRSLRSFDSSWMETLKSASSLPSMGHKKEALRGLCTVCAAVGLSGCQRCCQATVCCRAVRQLSGCHVRA